MPRPWQPRSRSVARSRAGSGGPTTSDVVCLKQSAGPQRARWVWWMRLNGRAIGRRVAGHTRQRSASGVGVRVHRMDLKPQGTSDDWSRLGRVNRSTRPPVAIELPDHAFDAGSWAGGLPLDAAGQQRAVGNPCRSRTVALGSLLPPLARRSVQPHCCALTTVGRSRLRTPHPHRGGTGPQASPMARTDPFQKWKHRRAAGPASGDLECGLRGGIEQLPRSTTRAT